MVKKIGDVVRPKDDAAFVHDVQLEWYAKGGSKNLSLARSYIFAKNSIGELKSPIDALYRFRQAYLSETFDNRFMVIATYGHGKSHLAVALANYFGTTTNSPEFKAVVSSIEHAFDGQPEGQSYREFRESRKKMLIVCLQGDNLVDLQRSFQSSLENALNAHSETRSVQLPGWTREASRLLDDILNSEKEVEKANTFLKERTTDFPGLVARVKSYDDSAFKDVCDVVRHLRGVTPNLTADASLADTIGWVVNQFCGLDEAKPFGGVFILFDEFSAFLRNYCLRGTAGTPLQDLLNGVNNHRGNVVFAAFGQLDPTATLDSLFSQNPGDPQRQALLVELTRLPPSCRFQLYTTMEDVVDSYLSQNSDVLSEQFETQQVWPAVYEASDDCLSLFERHYERQLGWNSEEFQERVTLGSYPLHPLTTALLCNVELRESANPRSVLGFVFDELNAMANKPVVSQQMPTWILPVRLVDQFGHQLADEEWKQYEEVLRQRGGDLTDEEDRLLKAMLLHVVGRMPTNIVVYSKAISSLSGLDVERTEELLQDLARVGLIDHQVAQGKYSFWSLGGGARLLHERINREISSKNLSWSDLTLVNRAGRKFERASLPVPVSWGHQNDWQAEQFYVTREFLTEGKVRELASKTRGMVLWLVPANDADVEWFEQNAQVLLDDAAGDPASPIIMMLPTAGHLPLIHAIQKYCALKKLTNQEVADFGGGIVQNVRGQVEKTIEDQTRALEGTKAYPLVPRLFAAAFNAGPISDKVVAIVKKAYQLAFASAPPAFFDQYKSSSSKLKAAVKLVCRLLLENKVGELTEGADPTAELLLRKFIVQGESTSWGLLSIEKQLQEPTAERTRRAWDQLETSIPADDKEMPIADVIQKLQRPPFGYDVNTLSLLFSAWFGFHRHSLRLIVRNAVTPRSELQQKVGSNPASFIDFLVGGDIKLLRVDRTAASKEVGVIAERTRHMSVQPYSRSEAVDAIAKLEEFLEDEANETAAERQEVEDARDSINAAIEAADKYDSDAQGLREESSDSSDIGRLLRTMARVSDLKPASGVAFDQPKQDVIRSEIKKRLSEVVTRSCKDNSSLPDLTHYREKKQRLEKDSRALSAHLNLKKQVSGALEALENAKLELDGRQDDRETIATLNVIETEGSLQQLRSRLACVDGATCHSRMAVDLQIAKRDAIERSIRKQEEFISKLDATLDAVRSTSNVHGASQELTAARSRYADSPEGEKISQAIQRCDKLQEAFRAMDKIDEKIYQLSEPDQVTELEHVITSVVSQYGEVLCPEQQATIRQRSTMLGQRAQTLENEAAHWLEDCRSRSKNAGKLGTLIRELHSPPAFLAASKRNDLNKLVANIQKKLDGDSYGQVIRFFKRITDRAERKRLLSELSSIVDAD